MSDMQERQDEAGSQAGEQGQGEEGSQAGEPGQGEEAPEAGTNGTEEGEEHSEESEGDEDEQAPVSDPLLPRGNRLRIARGAVAFGVGSLGAFILMALRSQLRWGVPLGAFFVLIATFGVLDAIGSFDDPDDRVHTRTNLRELGPALGVFAVGLAGLGASVSLAVSGLLRIATAAILVPAAFLMIVTGVYLAGDRLGVWEAPRGIALPIQKRHGFWLVVLMTLLYLPMLGSHSLSDPWETHYGEVAREILARNDWISLWWAQDGWFWSKPIFNFWVQALAMATFGVRYRSGELLSAVAQGRTPWPEWAVRLPIFLLTLLAAYLLYKAVAKAFSRRAGFLGALVLVTMPQWFFLAHQTMTDMPFVATMAASVALFLLGTQVSPEEQVRVAEVDLGFLKLRLSGFHLVMGVIVACSLPQVYYLFSRHLDIGLWPFQLRAHADAFSAGSPGNCGLPGNEVCRSLSPVVKGLYPSVQALIWLQTLAVLLYMNWGERRVSRLYYLGAWFFAALSMMAKGPAGIILPVVCALTHIAVSRSQPGEDWLMRRIRMLLRMEIVSGPLILLAVALPWFVAMYSRHGQPFTDRLFFHDMYKRAFTHVHDTNEGDDVSFRYYVWQLGYGMFPWTGLAPAGLLWWLRRREDGDQKGHASVILLIWFVVAFWGFSSMPTKFHHYIFPAIPPAAMLIGILLDDMLRWAGNMVSGKPAAETSSASHPYREPAPDADAAPKAAHDTGDLFWKWLHVAGIAAGTILLLLGISRIVSMPPSAGASAPSGIRSIAGLIMAFLRVGGLGAALTLSGVCIAVASVLLLGRYGRQAAQEDDEEHDGQDDEEHARAAGAAQPHFERLMLGAVGAGGGLLAYMVGRDIAGSREGILGQIRLLHLFTYNYKRVWPQSLDFTSTLWAFVIAASLLTALLAVAAWRRHVVVALCSAAVLFAAWGLNVFFVRTSPHWGQRETALAYYRARQEIPGPIIAYQMNWKGENFYVGNAIPAFVSSGKKFQDYIIDQKAKGIRTFYFFTEHGRTGSLSNELGNPKVFEKLTTLDVNNKFLLVRARFD